MDVVCSQCQGKFKIPDEKIPAEQVVFIPCPRCKQKLTLDTRTQRPPVPDGPVQSVASAGRIADKHLLESISSAVYDASDKPFDFLAPGAKTALICESDSGALTKLRYAVKQMGYHAVEAASLTEALKRMRFHAFELIVMNELFDGASPDDNPILTFLNDLVMSERRNIFVALLTTRFRTMDNMAAFNKSVNVVIHLKNLDEIGKILKRAIDEHHAFYGVFRELMNKTGRG